MEEDIKILEKLSKNNYYGDVTFTREAEAIENLLKAYKQDEEVIDKMAQTLLNYGFVLVKSKKGIIEHFRKLVVEDERN